MAYRQIAPSGLLPSGDSSFDIATSNAILEQGGVCGQAGMRGTVHVQRAASVLSTAGQSDASGAGGSMCNTLKTEPARRVEQRAASDLPLTESHAERDSTDVPRGGSYPQTLD